MMKDDLNQKLKQIGVSALLGGMLLTVTMNVFAKSPADPNKVLRYVFQLQKRVLTQQVPKIFILHMYIIQYLKAYIPMIIWHHPPN